jgi:hypothetical protein
VCVGAPPCESQEVRGEEGWSGQALMVALRVMAGSVDVRHLHLIQNRI